MSVKNKVKRLNEKIEELEEEIIKLRAENKTLGYIRYDRQNEIIQQYKDNFIKLILHDKMIFKDNCFEINIPKCQLEMMNHAKLEVKRSYEEFDRIMFLVRI